MPLRPSQSLWSVLAVCLACSTPSAAPPRSTEARSERGQVDIDDAFIAHAHLSEILEPVDAALNCDSLEGYESSLSPFSRAQRLLLALSLYLAEVDDGGHAQFFENETGIVWPDALAAFETIQVPEGAKILREAAKRMGGSPSRLESERQQQIERFASEFEDLDERLYALERRSDLRAKMLEYVRSRPGEFHFKAAPAPPAPRR